MEQKVKEILAEKGMRMAELANRLGVNQSNLQKMLAGNPTVSTLQAIARELGVETADLFSSKRNSVKSLMLLDGKAYGILESPTVVRVPHYTDYSKLSASLKKFIFNALDEKADESICGFLEAMELYSLTYDSSHSQFILSICYGHGQMLTYFFDVIEHSCPDGSIDRKQLFAEIKNSISEAVSMQTGF